MVMTGAIAVGVVAFGMARRRFGVFHRRGDEADHATSIDRRLVMGDVLFGVGWGVAEFAEWAKLWPLCSWPAMLAGMGIFELLDRRKQTAALRTA